MESSGVDRPITKFQLSLSLELRERLDRYVERARVRLYPAKLTKTDIINAALLDYLDREEANEAQAA
jgi:predicted transcriptional regulator